MGYDGKIKNGIELKEAEDNCIQRIIRKIFKRLKRKSEVWYSLSYDEEKHRYFDKNFLLNYLRVNYLNNNDIKPTKLSNDLITFKTYKDQLVSEQQNSSLFEKILTTSFAIVSILIAIGFGFLGFKDVIGKTLTASIFNNILYAIKLLLITFVIYIMFYVWRINNNSKLNSLKIINNAIYTLETIKEDMDRNGNSGTESDEIISSVNDKQDDGNTENIASEDADEIISSVNDKLDDGNTEDITAEDADERYEGLELTEVKEIRTYAYKATKNKYSPRAMYERKRR